MFDITKELRGKLDEYGIKWQDNSDNVYMRLDRTLVFGEFGNEVCSIIFGGMEYGGKFHSISYGYHDGLLEAWWVPYDDENGNEPYPIALNDLLDSLKPYGDKTK